MTVRIANFDCCAMNLKPTAKSLEFVDLKAKSARASDEPVVIAGERYGLPLLLEKVHRRQMERIQSSRGFGKGLQGPRQHRRSELDQGQATQESAHFVRMRSRQFTRVYPSPNLVLDEPARNQGLSPQALRRCAVFRQQMRQRNRSIEIDQRSSRSCSSSFCKLRKDVTGLRGGGSEAASAGGVIQPLRTASESKASASTGLLVLSGGTSSATTRSRSVTSTVSPRSARRTYSLSLFFRTFKPTDLINTNVASGSYQCQAPRA
jgi:hypothetical protein